MGENSDWADIGEEEQALLKRCRKFIFGSPDAPGNKTKDILYFTPCERWLRVCSGAAYDQQLDAGDQEMAFRLDSGKARELFDRNGSRPPPELDLPSIQRDFEVATDLKESLSCPPSNYGPRERLEEAVRLNPSNPYLRSDLLGHRPRSAYPVPADPRDIVGVEEVIERNTLLFILKEWSVEWPSEVKDAISSPEFTAQTMTSGHSIKLTPSEVWILRCLVATNQRLTQASIHYTLKNRPFKTPVKIPTIKKATPRLVEAGLIEYSQASVPRGFLATDTGRAYILKLDRPVS